MTRPLANSADARVFRPHPSLANQVSFHFTARVVAELPPQRLLPNGCVDLLFDLTGTPGELDAAVIGVTTGPVFAQRPVGTAVLGVTFWPGEALPFLGEPIDALRDRVVDLNQLFGNESSALVDSLRQLGSDEARIARIDDFLRSRAARSRPAPRLVRAALCLLRQHGGQLPVRALQVELGTSERTLERAFKQATGLSVKAMARIMRLHSVLSRIAHAPVRSLADLANEFGFADQAHLNREFRQLAGLSPGVFVRTRSLADSFKTVLDAEPKSTPSWPTEPSGSS